MMRGQYSGKDTCIHFFGEVLWSLEFFWDFTFLEMAEKLCRIILSYFLYLSRSENYSPLMFIECERQNTTDRRSSSHYIFVSPFKFSKYDFLLILL